MSDLDNRALAMFALFLPEALERVSPTHATAIVGRSDVVGPDPDVAALAAKAAEAAGVPQLPETIRRVRTKADERPRY